MRYKHSKYILRLSIAGCLAGGVVLLKEFAVEPNYAGNERLIGKTVIITGANSGIGKEAAHGLAKRGARIIMACRNMEKCKKVRKEIILDTHNKKVICMPCDLASQQSIREFAKAVNNDESGIDILINNAGVMRCEKSATKEGIEMQLGVNHMGHFLLTMLLLDKIKASAPSRIITLSSVAHEGGSVNFNDLNSTEEYSAAFAYQQSKLANILFTKELARRLKDSGVTSNCVHPGLVNTNLMRHMGFRQSWFSGIILRPLMWLILKSPVKGAQTILFSALSPDLEEISGQYLSHQKVTEVSEAAHNEADAKRLWAISERWTNLYS